MSSRLVLAFIGAVSAVAVASACSAQPAPGPVLKGAAAYGDWKADAPGVRRLITAADLPAPGATASSVGFAQPVEQPAGASLAVPAGFKVSKFASGFDGNRILRTAPNGDIFVAELQSGRVRVLRLNGDSSGVAENSVFADGLDQPFGMAFWPAGPNPQWVYIGQNNKVVRFPYANGDLKARGAPETIVPKLTDSTGGHWTRDLMFTPDGAKLFIAVGSQANFPDKIAAKTPAEIKAWEAQQSLGSAWGDETHRANVLQVNPDGSDLHVYAAGLRNCTTLTLQPGSGDLWCTVNERDTLGDNLVPDYATRVKGGAFYGWPWYYIGDHEQPNLKGQRPDLKGKVTVPDVLIQSHSAALQFAFYPATAAGPSAFPAEYRGDAFLALHGSWNRGQRTGYKVVRVRMNNGVPTGEYDDFLTGFVTPDGQVWGRPAGLAVLPDGSLLVSEDGNSTIWRVTYGG